MVDAGGEVDLGGLEGVIGGEVDVEIKDAATVGTVVRAQDRRTPMEEVTVVLWACRAVCGGIPTCKKKSIIVRSMLVRFGGLMCL